MTPEEINNAIAESWGWKWHRQGSYWESPSNQNTEQWPPDYYNDLNACAEMEKGLDASAGAFNNWGLYWDTLLEITQTGIFDSDISRDCRSMLHASAPQRCEAYLRVKGLWKE